MSNIEIVCNKNNIAYLDCRKAMVKNGARTKEELIEFAGVCGKCDGCEEHLNYLIEILCGCKEVPMEAVQNLVADGEKDMEIIMEKTKAGTGEDCGNCQVLIQSIIDQGY